MANELTWIVLLLCIFTIIIILVYYYKKRYKQAVGNEMSSDFLQVNRKKIDIVKEQDMFMSKFRMWGLDGRYALKVQAIELLVLFGIIFICYIWALFIIRDTGNTVLGLIIIIVSLLTAIGMYSSMYAVFRIRGANRLAKLNLVKIQMVNSSGTLRKTGIFHIAKFEEILVDDFNKTLLKIQNLDEIKEYRKLKSEYERSLAIWKEKNEQKNISEEIQLVFQKKLHYVPSMALDIQSEILSAFETPMIEDFKQSLLKMRELNIKITLLHLANPETPHIIDVDFVVVDLNASFADHLGKNPPIIEMFMYGQTFPKQIYELKAQVRYLSRNLRPICQVVSSVWLDSHSKDIFYHLTTLEYETLHLGSVITDRYNAIKMWNRALELGRVLREKEKRIDNFHALALKKAIKIFTYSDDKEFLDSISQKKSFFGTPRTKNIVIALSGGIIILVLVIAGLYLLGM